MPVATVVDLTHISFVSLMIIIECTRMPKTILVVSLVAAMFCSDEAVHLQHTGENCGEKTAWLYIVPLTGSIFIPFECVGSSLAHG